MQSEDCCFETCHLSLIVLQWAESPNHGRRCLRSRILMYRSVVVGRREKIKGTALIL